MRDPGLSVVVGRGYGTGMNASTTNGAPDTTPAVRLRARPLAFAADETSARDLLLSLMPQIEQNRCLAVCVLKL